MRTDNHHRSRIERSKKPSFRSTSCFIYPISGTAAVYQACQVYKRCRTCVVSTEPFKNLFCTISKMDFPQSHYSVPECKRFNTHLSRVPPNWVQNAPNILESKRRIFPRRMPYLPIILLPSVFSSRRNYLYQLNIGIYQLLAMSYWSHDQEPSSFAH